MDLSGKELVDFWSWVVSRGLVKANTARSFGAASKQVLGIDDDWETRDVSSIDVEDMIRRFKNIRQKDFKPESLNAYERRFRQGLSHFLEYKRDPGNWKFKGQDASSRRGRSGKNNLQAGEEVLPDAAVPTPRGAAPSISLMEYPFPLRENCIVKLRLPIDLKISEAERLSAFLKTLAVDVPVEK